jgi:murein L,D-transpeptidase YafK
MKVNTLTKSLFRVLCVIAILFTLMAPANTHADRPQNARLEKAQAIGAMFKAVGLTYPPQEVYLRAFKLEAQLELWARNSDQTPYVLVKTYPICMSSGQLGPKRVQGDGQVPEGVYKISVFNPQSAYYLSLGLNYPNSSDRILSDREHPGGDIFIHGNCVSIGCIPITDDGIKEVYTIAYDAYRRSRHIPVHIFPARLSDEAMNILKAKASDRSSLLLLWQDLKTIYAEFEQTRLVPKVRVDAAGRYILIKADAPKQD